MRKKTARLGFYAADANGWQLATFHAKNVDDVRRALRIEWGDQAETFRVERVPANTVGEAGGMIGDRHYDLMGNEGWGSLISAAEVEAMA